jgi:hypothetical protein
VSLFSVGRLRGFRFWISGSTDIPYFDFLDRLSITACTEGLTDLSVRCIQPIQQHGRRIPSLSSLIVLLTCSFLVSSFLTKVVQHIHSLRASGVRSSHAASAALSEVRAFRKSDGILCTVPLEICILAMGLFYQILYYPSGSHKKDPARQKIPGINRYRTFCRYSSYPSRSRRSTVSSFAMRKYRIMRANGISKSTHHEPSASGVPTSRNRAPKYMG